MGTQQQTMTRFANTQIAQNAYLFRTMQELVQCSNDLQQRQTDMKNMAHEYESKMFAMGVVILLLFGVCLCLSLYFLLNNSEKTLSKRNETNENWRLHNDTNPRGGRALRIAESASQGDSASQAESASQGDSTSQSKASSFIPVLMGLRNNRQSYRNQRRE